MAKFRKSSLRTSLLSASERINIQWPEFQLKSFRFCSAKSTNDHRCFWSLLPLVDPKGPPPLSLAFSSFRGFSFPQWNRKIRPVGFSLLTSTCQTFFSDARFQHTRIVWTGLNVFQIGIALHQNHLFYVSICWFVSVGGPKESCTLCFVSREMRFVFSDKLKALVQLWSLVSRGVSFALDVETSEFLVWIFFRLVSNKEPSFKRSSVRHVLLYFPKCWEGPGLSRGLVPRD